MNNLNILLVNNQSKSIESLNKFLLRFGTVKQIDFYNLKNFNVDDLDLIVLSGSSLLDPVEATKKVKDELDLIKNSDVPIIGICFGFELICLAFDCSQKKAQERFNDFRLVNLTGNYFKDVNKPIAVKEYHQWYLEEVNPKNLEILGTSSGVIEIIKHKTKRIIGFQFHPELFTELTQGDELLEYAIKDLTR